MVILRAPMPPPQGGVQDFERGDQVVVVGEGFAHAHNDDVVDEARMAGDGLGRFAEGFAFGGVGQGFAPAFHGEDLFHDLVDVEVAFPAIEAAGAEFAAVGAADLGGNAQGMAVAGLAVEGGVGGDENAFDEGAVREFPEKFLGGVMRALFAGELQGLERIFGAQLLPQTFGEIGHGVPGGDAAEVEPVEQLGGAVDGFVPSFELGFEGFAGQGFDIGQ